MLLFIQMNSSRNVRQIVFALKAVSMASIEHSTLDNDSDSEIQLHTKKRKIIKRDIFQNPTFLGPTLLHWDRDTDSYYKFDSPDIKTGIIFRT